MTDGTVLRADVHFPTDPNTAQPAVGPFPVLLSMTPYGKKAPPPAAELGGGPTPFLIRRGYIEVMVDVRGTGASGGSFEMFGTAQVQDGVELVSWAARLPNSTGAVGMFGLSYLGINQLFTASAVGPDSPLKAIFPAMAAHDFYRDAASMGGIARLPLVRAYRAAFILLNILNPVLEVAARGGHPRPRCGGAAAVRQRGRNQRRYFGALIQSAAMDGEHIHDGEFWAPMRPAEVLGRIVRNEVAVFLLGGWHDAFQRGAPLNYAGLQNVWAGRPVDAPMLPEQVTTDRFQLLMGPWYHISDFAGIHLESLQLRWFDHWLKGHDTDLRDPRGPLTLYELGGGRWLHTRAYPPGEAGPTRFYLGPGGTLTPDPPTTSTTTRLTYTPRGPVAGRSWEQWSLGATSYLSSRLGRAIHYDQDNRRIQRTGALVYTTAPFSEPAVLAGPITLTLHATATTSETIWVAHLDDLAPDGASTPLTQGALLGSRRQLNPAKTWYAEDGAVLRPFHAGHVDAVQPVVPGETIRYDLEIFPTTALVSPRHRIRITITTSDFPHLTPSASTRRDLRGGIYEVHEGGPYASYAVMPLADPEAFTRDTPLQSTIAAVVA